jgi:molybdenum cofactor biosynthesis enzyme MoaA
MKELDIKVGYQCNNACVFCLSKDKWHLKEFSFEELQKQIELFAESGGKKLLISGGEPLISKYFLNLLIFAKRKGIKFLIIETNGRMLFYEEMVKKLKHFGPIRFLVSFHFPNDKLYRKYNRSNGFYQTMQGIRNLIKHNCNFTINIVVMKPNLRYLKNMVKMLKKGGVKKIQYEFINGGTLMKNDYEKFVPRYSDCVTVIKEIIKENRDIRITLNEIPVCVLGKKFKKYLAPCINLKKSTLNAVYRLMPAKEMKSAQFTFPNCKGCIYKSLCVGVAKEYVQTYGAKEFKPLTNDQKATSSIKARN